MSLTEQPRRAAPPVVQQLDVDSVNAALAVVVKRMASLEERVRQLELEASRRASDGR